jgi:hypothetical protein
MSIEAAPGTKVNVKIKKTPTNQAAAKTLSRLFAKGPGASRARRFRKKLLAGSMDVRRRGGRPWEVRQRAPALFKPAPGDACTILATCDVLKDLRSVAAFVEVSPA